MRVSNLIRDLESSADRMVQLDEIRFGFKAWNHFKRYVENNEESPAAWIKHWHYYEMYSDEDQNYMVKTDCPINEFELILKAFKEKNTDHGYTWDDFFEEIEHKGYEIKILSPEASLYF